MYAKIIPTGVILVRVGFRLMAILVKFYNELGDIIK
jgi:hypothetical protein